MKTCPLCGSPASQWPDFASDYVRGYSLCEYHMSFAVKKSLRQEFKAKKHFDSIKYNKMYEALSDFIENLCEENNSIGSMGESIDGYNYCPVSSKFYDDAYSGVEFQPLVDPSMQYIDDASVDEWIAQRLRSLAHEKEGRVHRCSAYKEHSPDNRCTGRGYVQGGLCDRCQENNVKNRIGGLDDPKMIAALECLRSTNAGQKVAA